jgi:hypothetical protein
MRAEAIVQLADMLGVRAGAQRKTYVTMECPLAPVTHKTGTDNHPSLSVLVRDGDRSGWICHSCGQKGTLPGLVIQWSLYTKKDATAALDLIEKEENSIEAICGRVDRKWDEKWKQRDEEAVAGTDFEVFSEEELEPFLGRVPRYIVDRGFRLETCKAWGLGYDRDWRDPETGANRPRVVIPIRRADGKLVGMAGRAIDDEKKEKYWNYWNFAKSRYLFGQHMTSEEPLVAVVEGEFDVIRWWEHGINVVGLMGSHPSEAQFRMLASYETIFLALDKDDSGLKGRDEISKRLGRQIEVYDTTFPDGKTDPDELTREEAEYCLLHARKLL